MVVNTNINIEKTKWSLQIKHTACIFDTTFYAKKCIILCPVHNFDHTFIASIIIVSMLKKCPILRLTRSSDIIKSIRTNLDNIFKYTFSFIFISQIDIDYLFFIKSNI